MKVLKIFIGLCGSCRNGYESSGRGESRWAQQLARCFTEAGHQVFMAPDAEDASWGNCQHPSNAIILQAHEKRRLHTMHFDVAIFTSWQTKMEEALFIHADKYLWGVMSWKHEIMKDGYFLDNDYVIRWQRSDLPAIPYPINFKDRCFLLSQPFGKEPGNSKFSNKRVAWTAKEIFLETTEYSYSVAAKRHLYAVVDACKATDSSLSIFSCSELDKKNSSRISEMGIDTKIGEICNKVTLNPTLPFSEYQEALKRCSVVVPVGFAGSILESVFFGIVPLVYKDGLFFDHPWISGVCNDFTMGKSSRDSEPPYDKNVLTRDEISKILTNLLTDECYYEDMLYRMRPMITDNIDSHALSQLEAIMKHKCNTTNVRR